MDEEALNRSVRRFLKKLGIAAQREIESAVRGAAGRGALEAPSLEARARIRVEGVDLDLEVKGTIETG